MSAQQLSKPEETKPKLAKPPRLRTFEDVKRLITATKSPIKTDLTSLFREGLAPNLPFLASDVSDPANTEDSLARRQGVASCKLCGVVEFSGGFVEQRAHFRSHWHTINLLLSEQGKSSVSEDVSGSILLTSSSEDEDDFETSSEEEEEADAEQPISLHQRNHHDLTCMLEDPFAIRVHSSVAKDELELKSLLSSQAPNWAIILYRSGHFACAIYRAGRLVEHKTEHQYTQRRKQGGSQAAQDEKGFKARSAGAMLRRHGEQTMRERVAQVLSSWDFASCDRIFLAIPERARRLFVFSERKGKQERDDKRFLKSDTRIRRIPFMTSRPTLDECERVFGVMNQVEFCSMEFETAVVIDVPEPSKVEATADKVEPIRVQTEEDEKEKFKQMGLYNRAMHQSVIDNNVDLLVNELASHPEDIHTRNYDGESPLHLACSLARLDLLELLLDRIEPIDLLVKDALGRLPYQRAKDASVRDVLRAFRGDKGEAWTDWNATTIPEPPKDKSADEIQARKDKEKEKKRRQQERKRQERAEKEARDMEEQQKRVAEELAIKLAGSCPICSKALPAKKKDRFSQGEKEFCSAECLRTHTRKLAADAADKRFSASVKQ